MPRRARVEIEGGLYHVYNRVASGESVLGDAEEALRFVEVIREVKRRDGWTVYARGEGRRAADSVSPFRRTWKLQAWHPWTIQKAATYLLNHWDGLTVFVRNPDVSLDNNACERDLRQLVQGRKNHYGSGSDRGLQTSAVLYTLVQTCLKLGVDPELYLSEAIRRRRANPSEIYLPRHAAAEATDR